MKTGAFGARPGSRPLCLLAACLAAAGAIAWGCGLGTKTYPGVAAYFIEQFQQVEFIPPREKDKFETTAQYQTWCARRASDNAERIADRAKALVSTSFIAAVPAEVADYDADHGQWKVSAVLQTGTVASVGLGTAAPTSAPTVDDRYWCSFSMFDTRSEDKNTVLITQETPPDRKGQKLQRIEALILSPPEEARNRAKSIPEKQKCELWLYLDVRELELAPAGPGAKEPTTDTPTEADVRCTPKLRITRIELRTAGGSLAYTWPPELGR